LYASVVVVGVVALGAVIVVAILILDAVIVDRGGSGSFTDVLVIVVADVGLLLLLLRHLLLLLVFVEGYMDRQFCTMQMFILCFFIFGNTVRYVKYLPNYLGWKLFN